MSKQIEIRERMAPFSHSLGISCLIPTSSYGVEVYPTRLRLIDYHSQPEVSREIIIPLLGPIFPFTVQQDLERGEVRVFGHQKGGEFFSYRLTREGQLIFEKGFKKKERIAFFPPSTAFVCKERLFLGNTKKQEWEKIKERRDLAEIFPLWVRLGFSLPMQQEKSDEGMFALLKTCANVLENKEHDQIHDCFLELFLASFEKMMVPRLVDHEYQGICSPALISPNSSPLPLLVQSAHLIRSLFITYMDEEVFVLPHLAPQFPSGKMTDICIPALGELHIEWTKKKMRRAQFLSYTTKKIFFHFPPNVDDYRVRTTFKEKKGDVLPNHSPLFAEKGKTYFFDLFQK